MRQFIKEGLGTKQVAFMGGEVEVRKTSIADIKAIQAELAKLEAEDEAERGILSMYAVCRKLVIGAEDMTDEEFETFPIEDLVALVEGLMNGPKG